MAKQRVRTPEVGLMVAMVGGDTFQIIQQVKGKDEFERLIADPEWVLDNRHAISGKPIGYARMPLQKFLILEAIFKVSTSEGASLESCLENIQHTTPDKSKRTVGDKDKQKLMETPGEDGIPVDFEEVPEITNEELVEKEVQKPVEENVAEEVPEEIAAPDEEVLEEALVEPRPEIPEPSADPAEFEGFEDFEDDDLPPAIDDSPFPLD